MVRSSETAYRGHIPRSTERCIRNSLLCLRRMVCYYGYTLAGSVSGGYRGPVQVPGRGVVADGPSAGDGRWW